MDKFTRQLSLVALLEQSPWPLTFQEIRERLKPEAYPQPEPESARRAFERDKKDLLAMGVPLDTREVPDDPSMSAYAIDQARSAVGDPGFTPAELAALHFAATAMALRQEGVEAIADATDGLRKYGGLGEGTTAPTLAELRLDASVSALFSAIVERRVVGFTYAERTRRVYPRQLAHIEGHWYLRCHDLDAGTTRTYRLDRIDGAVLPIDDATTDRPGSADPPAAPTPMGELRFRPWEFGTGRPERVRVRLDAPAAAVALADDPGLEVAYQDAEAWEVVLSVRSPEGLWSWLAAFLDRAEILGPPAIRDAWVEHLRTLAGATGGEA